MYQFLSFADGGVTAAERNPARGDPGRLLAGSEDGGGQGWPSVSPPWPWVLVDMQTAQMQTPTAILCEPLKSPPKHRVQGPGRSVPVLAQQCFYKIKLLLLIGWNLKIKILYYFLK